MVEDGGGWWRMVGFILHTTLPFTVLQLIDILYNISISGGLEDRI
jgi:hypothetical protein